ncbi:MAG: hypothetical protein ABSD98_05325 [Candidatus Korobacteraceae bacterium]|jgi:hypothetical protein
MRKNNVVLEDGPAAPALTPDLVSKIKKEDMKQAIVERFSGSRESTAPRTPTGSKKRSPYWQAADDQC